MAEEDDADLRDAPTELDGLREDWEAIFDESMPWGFGIDVEQIPILRQCIAERSQDALEAYFATYPDGVLF